MSSWAILLLFFCFAPFGGTNAAAVRNDVTERRKRSDDVSMGSLQVLVQQQAATIQQLQSRLTAVENSIPSTFQQVAFTVSLTHDILDLHPGEIIKFDQLDTNLGNGYSPLTGVFTAPVAGLYCFSLSFMSVVTHGHMYLAIEKQGTILGAAFADGQQDWDQGSALATTHLAKGEQVFARQEQFGSAIRGFVHTTTFSGFLVHADTAA